MAKTKQEAQERYDAAVEARDEAQAALLEAREELDGFLREEEAERQAAFLGFEPGDGAGVKAAKGLMERRREQKARNISADAYVARSSGEAIGGLG